MYEFSEEELRQQADLFGYESAVKQVIHKYLKFDYSTIGKSNQTPRQDWAEPVFRLAPLWYIKLLVDINPEYIVDLGCGANYFKPVVDSIFNTRVHGIDPDSAYADENDLFDAEFSVGHTDYYPAAMSINALHFIPLADLKKRIYEFHNIIAPGGRGFLALNADRLIAHSPDNNQSLTKSADEVTNYVWKTVNSCKDIDFIVKEVYVNQQLNEPLDGNIRLVFNK